MNKNKTTQRAISAMLTLFLGALAVPAYADPSALWACKGITVNQVGPTTVSVGGRLDYEIHVKNDGDCDLTGSSVVDFIPRRSIFYQASPEPTDLPIAHAGSEVGTLDMEHPVSRIEWKNVSLGSGKDTYFKVSAHVQGPEDRILLNTVCFENTLSGRICSQAETTVTR